MYASRENVLWNKNLFARTKCDRCVTHVASKTGNDIDNMDNEEQTLK